MNAALHQMAAGTASSAGRRRIPSMDRPPSPSSRLPGTGRAGRPAHKALGCKRGWFLRGPSASPHPLNQTTVATTAAFPQMEFIHVLA